MSVAKVIEIKAESDTGFEDAVHEGIKSAAETVHNIRGAWIKGQQVVVDDNKIIKYRVDLKVSFVLD